MGQSLEDPWQVSETFPLGRSQQLLYGQGQFSNKETTGGGGVISPHPAAGVNAPTGKEDVSPRDLSPPPQGTVI